MPIGSSAAARDGIVFRPMNVLRRFDLLSYLALAAFAGYLLAPLLG